MNTVHHCPRCDLRFTTTAELQEHFTVDHGAHPDTFTRFRYPAARSAPPPTDHRRRLLVVANQTLDDEDVVDRLARLCEGTHTFVLVPATKPEHADAEVGAALARFRLRRTIDRLRGAGLDAEGEVGHPDPFYAVVRVFDAHRFDEIVVSPLPAGASRWLDADLPARLERRCHVPVRVLERSLLSGR